MNAEVHLDPFAAPPSLDPTASDKDLEVAWFDAPRHSSRPPFPCARASAPPPELNDPVADPWFK
jgi:hypothetical protein